MNKWNVYMLALGELEIKDSKIDGPRIGLCSTQIDIIKTNIDASHKGCQHDSGLGRGSKKDYCAASGGSHGGKGGFGASETLREKELDEAQCQENWPRPYYFGHEARYEGSGGGSGDQKKTSGGSGGGVIWLTTPDKLLLIQSVV
jgi:hypothetical protein